MKLIRRLKAKTDYLARRVLLSGEKPRIIFRKTNRYIIGQYVRSKEAQDFVLIGLDSKELLDYGWPKSESIKCISAAYLTGYLLGKKIIDKEDKAEAILDIGLLRSIAKSKIYAFLKGVIDSGVKIKADSKIFPDEARISGRHLKKTIDFNKIKENINKKFI